MKRIASILSGIAMALVGLAGPSYAAEATAHIYATVDPNITVAFVSAVQPGSVSTGDLFTQATFRVDANVQTLLLSAAASPLYKGDDPTNLDVAPIPVNLTKGILINPANASPTGGRTDKVAAFTGGATSIEGFPGEATEAIQFESSQSGHFSQNVMLQVHWNQADPEKPTGEYSGKVKFVALL